MNYIYYIRLLKKVKERRLGGATGWQERVFSICAVYSKLQPA